MCKNEAKDNRYDFGIFFQLLVISILWSSYFVGGMSMGSPTVVIPQLRKEANSTEAVTSEMASWLSKSPLRLNTKTLLSFNTQLKKIIFIR